MQRTAIGAAGLTAALALFYWAQRAHQKSEPSPHQVNDLAAPVRPPGAKTGESPSSLNGETVTDSTQKKGTQNARRVNAVPNRDQAEKLRAAIAKFWLEQPTQDANAAASTPQAPPLHTLEDWTKGDYMSSVLKDQYIPLAKSCYQAYLQREPQATGRVVVEFNISGVAELGAVIENVKLGEDSTLNDEAFATCLSESMYGLALEAPPKDAKTMTAKYGLVFSPDTPNER